MYGYACEWVSKGICSGGRGRQHGSMGTSNVGSVTNRKEEEKDEAGVENTRLIQSPSPR